MTIVSRQHTPALVILLTFHWGFVQSFSSRYHGSLGNSKQRHSRLSKLAATSSFTDSVQIFDNIFATDVCEELHCLALDHADRCGVRSSIFYWNDDDDDCLLTPLEQALKSCLQQMPITDSMDCPVIVEYWSRDEYLNMDTHSDIDEQELLNEGTLRCPDFGHVLYLDVASSIRGPTCVFSKLGGWNSNPEETSEAISLVTVPAVPGRVLRFPGAAMHAVPKPSTLWFLNKEEQRKALMEDEEKDFDDDEYDEEEDLVQRSVILFNVWTKEGPLGVSEDIDSKGMLPDGIELIEEDSPGDDDNESYTDRQKEQRRAVWDEEFGTDCSDLWCQPRSEWQGAQIVDTSEDSTYSHEKISVPLMGNKARRLHYKSHSDLSSPSTLREALQEASTPHHFLLQTESI